LGTHEVNDLAPKIKDLGIEVLFVSPRIRAQETAKILNEKLGVEIKTMDGFRERNQNGILTGMKRSEAKEKYPEMVELVKDRFNTIEGAEDYESFRKRIVSAFNEVTKSDYKTVAVVTHGGPIRRIFGDILGMEKKWEIDDCGWFEIDYSDGKSSLVKTEGIFEEK
jgi:broad specificity phosphatase PhoE